MQPMQPEAQEIPYFDEAKEALALGVRNKIYKVVEGAPGLHFREIQRRTNLAIGSLQYHLEYLQKKHLLRSEREGKFVRYYAIRAPDLGADTQLMNLLRQQSIRRIALFLLTRKRASNAAIAAAIGVSPSTASWHIDKLIKTNIVTKKRRGRKCSFYLVEPDRVRNLILNYRKSFLDELVDGFAEIWDQMEAANAAKESAKARKK